MAHRGKREAVAYLRTSSAANVGRDKDSETRQRTAVAAYAKAAGYVIVDSYYDEAVSGADQITKRSGFAAMLERIASNGVRTIIVENGQPFCPRPNRARDWLRDAPWPRDKSHRSRQP